VVSPPILISENASLTNEGTADQYQPQIPLAWPVFLSWRYAECYRYLQPPNPPTKNNNEKFHTVSIKDIVSISCILMAKMFRKLAHAQC